MKIKIKKIYKAISNDGWFRFGGKKRSDCPKVDTYSINFYLENNKLPEPCNKCYKGLIFWENSYSKQTVISFFKMMASFELYYSGKLNEKVVVFYFRSKEEMFEFLDHLKVKINEFNVRGLIQWRKACKKYKNLNPLLWRNAKTFIQKK